MIPVILCSSLRILFHACCFLGLLPFKEEVMCGREVTGKAYMVPPLLLLHHRETDTPLPK